MCVGGWVGGCVCAVCTLIVLTLCQGRLAAVDRCLSYTSARGGCLTP